MRRPTEQLLWNIQKGVPVNRHYVVHIDKNAVYTMVNNMSFKGRGRLPSEHSNRRIELEMKKLQEHNPLSFLEKCTIMEDAPIAFCVIELVFHAAEGHGIDFIFRYCNREMEVLEGIPVAQMINKSFYEVFPHRDKKWIIPYADKIDDEVVKAKAEAAEEMAVASGLKYLMYAGSTIVKTHILDEDLQSNFLLSND